MTGWFVSILKWIHSWLGSYGWSVIVFSLLIKLCLLPLDIKSRRSMRAMSALNPQLEKLKARYANDQEKLNQKMQELYRKNKVNPLSGCLPLLIQLPILYIMFAAMRYVAAEIQLTTMGEWIKSFLSDGEGNLLGLEALQDVIEGLRNGSGLVNFGDTQGWLWVKSVFQPDSFSKTVIPTVSDILTNLNQYKDKIDLAEDLKQLLVLYANDTNGIASAVDNAVSSNVNYFSFNLFLNWFKISIPRNWGTYVNGYFILPVLAGVSQWLSTKLQPTAADTSANTSGSGKFMKWFFPIFSVWICISSNAAFAIYWVFVNAWSIVSTIIINKMLDKEFAAKGNSSQPEKEALRP